MNYPTISSEELAAFEAELKNHPQALQDLEVLRSCEGDLECASRVLARRAGAEIVRGSEWLTQALEVCRTVICEKEFESDFAPGVISAVSAALVAYGNPVLLALTTTAAICLVKVGIRRFCEESPAE